MDGFLIADLQQDNNDEWSVDKDDISCKLFDNNRVNNMPESIEDSIYFKGL